MRQSKGFYKWAWGIVEGCQNGCEYCYAKDMVKGDFSIPVFHEDLLEEPYKVPPARIFVNHLSDIMGEWIPDEWINRILEVCIDLPEHTFIWMTKLPQRYWDFIFPANCILGVTIESPDKWGRADIVRRLMDRKMCSIEPILGDFTGKDFSQFEFVVVGCLIGQEDHSFYQTVKHKNIYYTR